jgi:hypothetical protein
VIYSIIYSVKRCNMPRDCAIDMVFGFIVCVVVFMLVEGLVYYFTHAVDVASSVNTSVLHTPVLHNETLFNKSYLN